MSRRLTKKQKSAARANLDGAREVMLRNKALKAAGFPKGTDFDEALRVMKARLQARIDARDFDGILRADDD